MEFTFRLHLVLNTEPMKTDLTLSIPKPCGEKWNTFTPTPDGGFCGSCSKVVIDFTKMSDEQMLSYLKNKPTHSCGRVRVDQLKTFSPAILPSRISPGMTLLKAGFVSLLLLLVSKQSSGQTTLAKNLTENVQLPTSHNALQTENVIEQWLNGVVTSAEDGSALPGVNVVLKGASVGTVTDHEGRFSFPQKLKEGDVLVFSFIGLRSHEYRIRANDAAEISIKLEMDIEIMMGELLVETPYTKKTSESWWSKFKNRF
jgi:hypothetical protein